MSIPYRQITWEECELMELPLRRGDVREDGYIFRKYYQKGNRGVKESWMSPEAYQRERDNISVHWRSTYYKHRNLIQRYKTIYGCSECGYRKHPAAIHFDHLDPKEKTNLISYMYDRSLKAIKEEMAKCRLLCANCHAIHSAKQREEGVHEE